MDEDEDDIALSDADPDNQVDQQDDHQAPSVSAEAQGENQEQDLEKSGSVDAIAKVKGAVLSSLPRDLYIPPDALEIFLEAFEGPMDLLLYLIKRNNLDILDIPVAEITSQYMRYIEMMKELQFELAADYLVMAAMLAEIKSRMLLPRPIEEADEDDPRAELVRRLQQYERFKKAAENLQDLPRIERNIFQTSAEPPELTSVRPLPDIAMEELMSAFNDVLKRAEMYTHHQIQLEPLSVRERMSIILDRIQKNNFTKFTDLFTVEEGRLGVVVTLIAILELMKESLIDIVQTEPYEPIHIKVA